MCHIGTPKMNDLCLTATILVGLLHFTPHDLTSHLASHSPLVQGLRLLPSWCEDVEGLAEPEPVASRGEDTHEGRASGHFKSGVNGPFGAV